MKVRKLMFLLAAVFCVCLMGCGEEKALGLVFAKEEYFLSPPEPAAVEVLALYESSDSGRPVLAEELEFFSSEPELFQADHLGRVAPVSEAAVKDVLSGFSFLLTARWRGMDAQCRIIIRKHPEQTAKAPVPPAPYRVLLEPEAIDALVNKQRALPESYIPADLVWVSVPTCLVMEEVNHLRLPASKALSELFAAAQNEAGHELVARSGYRSYVTQKALYNNYVRTEGQEYADKYSARPGTSEHQTGLVMDITSPGMNYILDESFGETPEGTWVAENAHRFGFIIRYPLGKEDVTGYAYEPWHLRYVGTALAEELYRRGLVMEEFFALP